MHYNWISKETLHRLTTTLSAIAGVLTSNEHKSIFK